VKGVMPLKQKQYHQKQQMVMVVFIMRVLGNCLRGGFGTKKGVCFVNNMTEKYDGKLCKHESATFRGMYSLIGVYVCDNCKKEIDPVEYHRIMQLPHVLIDVEKN
jgi:hypothetical protein